MADLVQRMSRQTGSHVADAGTWLDRERVGSICAAAVKAAAVGCSVDFDLVRVGDKTCGIGRARLRSAQSAIIRYWCSGLTKLNQHLRHSSKKSLAFLLPQPHFT